MKPFVTPALVVVLSSCLGGPFDNVGEEEPFWTVEYEWSLGLNIPEDDSEWPQPGPFFEPVEELEYWYAVIEENYSLIFAHCPFASRAETRPPTSDLDFPIHLATSIAARCGINGPLIEAAKSQVLHAEDDSILEEWREEAHEKWIQSRDALSGPAAFPNITSVEIMSLLMGHHIRAQATYKDAESNYAEFRSTGSASSLERVLKGYHTSSLYFQAIENFFHVIDDDGQRCGRPSINLEEKVVVRLSNLLEEYREFEGLREIWDERSNRTEMPPLPIHPGYSRYNIIENFIIPRAVVAVENDWWPYLLRLHGTIGMYEEYFHVATSATSLPTYEEALWLRAEYLNRTRSIVTDGSFVGSLNISSDEGAVWEHLQRTAVRVLAQEGMEWKFDLAECEPTYDF